MSPVVKCKKRIKLLKDKSKFQWVRWHTIIQGWHR